MDGYDKESCHRDCICKAMAELKEIQDMITGSSTKYFGKLLSNLIKVDTLPFILLTENGALSLSGFHFNKSLQKEECFQTSFFRIEETDVHSCCATVSLLLPINILGESKYSLSDVIILKRTNQCAVIDLSCICAIQVLDFELMKRDIIIEPK
ncbi:CotY/CotZ family spore coat protein [Niallia sp. 01092]|uniref:CotY/CotZ family spore coat protein n=1 Tax=unclassified Niallia TaxID=2837522 RepID=UPI003FD61B37